MSETTLYTIGNGFDLAHHLPTSYEDFHKWLLNSKDYAFVKAFESLYPDVKSRHGLWCDIESALKYVSLEDAVCFDMHYQECPDEIGGENSSHDAYQCGANLRRVIDVLPACLLEWVQSTRRLKCPVLFNLCDNSYFFSFNYTLTLENVYHIEESRIMHVHGKMDGCSNLVMGYDEDCFDEDDYTPSDPGVDMSIIISNLRKNKKPVRAITQFGRFRAFMKALAPVGKVIVFGHSCSNVDKYYFKQIADSIKDGASWVVYVHNNEKNKSVERYFDFIRKRNQSVTITNNYPIQRI